MEKEDMMEMNLQLARIADSLEWMKKNWSHPDGGLMNVDVSPRR